MADVYFAFPYGNRIRIPAHKRVLSMRSPVFKAMFYGTFPHDDGDIQINDITSDIFKMMIRHMYTEKVSLDNESVISMAYAAKKYQLESLSLKCLTFLQNTLSVDNACTIYKYTKTFSKEKLKECVLKYISDNANEVMKTGDFMAVSPEDMADILRMDFISVEESTVVEVVLKWADTKLSKKANKIDGKARRRVLLQHDILYLLPIPLLSMEEYTTVVIPSGILSEEEHFDMFKAITVKTTRNLHSKFRVRPRNVNSIIVSMDEICHKRHNWNLLDDPVLVYRPHYNESEETIKMRPSRNVKIVSVLIKPRYRYRVQPFQSEVTCTIKNKTYNGMIVHGGSLKMSINLLFNRDQTSTLSVCIKNNAGNQYRNAPTNGNCHRYSYDVAYQESSEWFYSHNAVYQDYSDFSDSHFISERTSVQFDFSGSFLVENFEILELS